MYECIDKECRLKGTLRFATGGNCPDCNTVLQEETKDIEQEHEYTLRYPELVNRYNKITHKDWCAKTTKNKFCAISDVDCIGCKYVFEEGIKFGKLDEPTE